MPYYGYGVYPNVYTALEIERLVNASGPTAARSSCATARHPKAVGIIHCVGSRDENTNRWCSRVCCLYSLKLAHLTQGAHRRRGLQLLHRHAHARAKSTEEFYNQLAEEGVHVIRGRWPMSTDWALPRRRKAS